MELSRADLEPGALVRLFQRGAKAVILVDDPRVACLWQGLVGEPRTGSTQPWDGSIVNAARNHRPGDTDLGDMLRFTPGAAAYIARKVQVFPGTDGRTFRVVPDIRPVLPHDIVCTAWELMSDLIESAGTERSELSPYAVAIELLKYPDSTEQLDEMFSLLTDASGKWTRWGRRVDAAKGTANSFFDARVMRDLFAWASLLPGFGRVLSRVNASLERFGHRSLPPDSRLIGGPHVDRGRFITALASQRETVTTEIHDGRKWRELPLSPGSLAVLPSMKLDKSLGIPPTLHRVLLSEDGLKAAQISNLTLLLAVVDRPAP